MTLAALNHTSFFYTKLSNCSYGLIPFWDLTGSCHHSLLLYIKEQYEEMTHYYCRNIFRSNTLPLLFSEMKIC